MSQITKIERLEREYVHMKRLTVLALPLTALALSACGSSSSSTSSSAPSPTPAPASSGNSVAVTMQSIAFNPQTIHAKVGQTIKWTNMDQVGHNVTYVSGPQFTSSSTFGNGGTFSLKLTKAGTIQYRCTIHPAMTATIVVAP
jgi:plastocyanin